MIHRFAFFVLIAFASSEVLALDVAESNAQEVDLSSSSAVLNSHESILLGLSCKSGPIGMLEGVSVIKIGDTVTAGGRSFRVGIIEVTKYNEDAKWGNEVLAKKGDVVCVLAPNAASLPYDDDCNALWVNVPGCRVLR